MAFYIHNFYIHNPGLFYIATATVLSYLSKSRRLFSGGGMGLERVLGGAGWLRVPALVLPALVMTSADCLECWAVAEEEEEEEVCLKPRWSEAAWVESE